MRINLIYMLVSVEFQSITEKHFKLEQVAPIAVSGYNISIFLSGLSSLNNNLCQILYMIPLTQKLMTDCPIDYVEKVLILDELRSTPTTTFLFRRFLCPQNKIWGII